MRRLLSSRRAAVLLVVAVIAGVVAGVAGSALIFSQTITDTTNVRLRVDRRVVTGSFDSGWHVHPGLAIVQVQSGQIQIYENGCTPTTVAAGQTFIEVPHLPVRAIATGDLSWTTTFVLDGNEPIQIPLATYVNNAGYNPCPSLP